LSWFKVNLTCNRNDTSLIEEILVAHGAISISMIDEEGKNPIYEPMFGETPLWDKVKISALFEETISKEIIGIFLDGIWYSNLYITILDEQNWIEKYQKNFNSIKFSNKLWVAPSWSKEILPPESIKVVMDPGMAFGSGSHETTHLCLQYLDSNPPKNLYVIDYGCGSGILGISSILLGARKVVAVDIDPQAIISTTKNSKLNKVSNKICILDSEQVIEDNADILIANIYVNTLINLRDHFLKLIKSGGRLIFSGVQDQHLDRVVKNFESGADIINSKQLNEWCLIEMAKK